MWRPSVQPDNHTAKNQSPIEIAWVTAAEIAKELNVKPPVLGNWRKRYSDFPATKKSETGLFLYNRSEVLRWRQLQEQGSTSTSSRIWNLINYMRDGMDEGEYVLTGLALLCLIKLGKVSPDPGYKDRILVKKQGAVGEVLLSVFEQWERYRRDIDPIWAKFEAVRVGDISTWLSAFDELPKGRVWQDTTAEPINELVAGLVEHINTTIFDPVTGRGHTLLRIAKQNGGTADGQEINQRSREICILRAFLLDLSVNIKLGDSLVNDEFASKRYQVVVADPPMGMKLSEGARSKSWPLGSPGSIGDWAWAQHVVSHLAANGEGYINLSSGALSHRQSSEIRREMIRRGCVEAVISLPPLSTAARVPLALLCLRAPDVKTGVGVLMIDANDMSSRRVEEFVSSIPDIVSKVMAFRANPDSFIADEQSVVVPVLDLLQGDCSLVPTQHIARSRKSEVSYTGYLRPLLESLRSGANAVALHLSDTSVGEFELTHVPLKTLRLKETANIISGVRIDAEIQRLESGMKSKTPGSQAVLTVRALRTPGPLLSTEYIEEEQFQTRGVTQSGDIVITRIGESQAKVDADGGNLVLAPLSILRLDSQFDPYVVAAALNSEHVRKLTTAGGIGRIDLDMLEIPQITGQKAQVLRETLLKIEHLEADIEVLRQQLVEWHKIGGDYLATASKVKL
jgi:hypothetical protein